MSNDCCQTPPSSSPRKTERLTDSPAPAVASCCKDESACRCESEKSCCKGGSSLGHIYGAGLLRLWLAVRAIQTGVEKYAGMKGSEQLVKLDGKPNDYGLTEAAQVKEYALAHYHGVPEALMQKFQAEPLMNAKLLLLYDKVLGPALIVLGLTILLGLFTRTSLFLLGLLYISLTFGLVLIKEDSGVAWLGIHMIMIVMALAMSKDHRFCILKKW